MHKATERQKVVMAFITDYIQAHGFPPTIREIADYLSISIKGAHDHVIALRKKGFLTQEERKSRTLEVNREKYPVSGEEGVTAIPILGTVAAGKPILSEENLEGSVKMHPSMLKKNSRYFALRVKGESMVGAGIFDGDIAVIEQQPAVRNGEIAVVMLEDAVTLKTFYRENARVRLQPENPGYKPIYCSSDVRVLGKLAHILRCYA